MLLELLESATTPAPLLARRMGLVYESIAIGARYRRCSRDWQDHLLRCHAAIGSAIESAPKHRLAVILGCGGLYDVPWRMLRDRFDRVVLVDMVFPWRTRLRSLYARNFRLCSADVTGILHQLPGWSLGDALPTPPHDFSLWAGPVPDLIVSANILSQLALFPTRLLRQRGISDGAAIRLTRRVIEHHLARLDEFSDSVRCLITDISLQQLDPSARVLEQRSVLADFVIPDPTLAWCWCAAPLGEIDHKTIQTREVIAVITKPS